MQIEIKKIIRSNRKTIAVEIAPDSSLIIRAPKRLPLKIIKDLVQNKEKWIREKLQEIELKQKLYQPLQFKTGDELWYLGEKYIFSITDSCENIFLHDYKLYFPQDQQERAAELLKQWYKEQSKKLLPARAEYYSQLTGIKFNSIKITGARKRWGSCSSGGNLNFTWRLIMAPLRVIDYVVVHELVHIEFMNHSRQFWARVGEIMPDYKEQKQWLRENQLLLELM
ncbi:hypothetical protein CTH_1853 [Carboxydocella thermautotrophica]|nr:hypothetical protein CTH_1853 [Carboxydocella thermautotrophica]